MGSSRTTWGWGVSLIVAVICAADVATMAFAPGKLAGVMQATGFSAQQLPFIATILTFATALYLFPRTALPGAILLTGFFGGAICTHVRIGEYASAPQIICFAIAALAWVGLALRDPAIGRRLSGAGAGRQMAG